MFDKKEYNKQYRLTHKEKLNQNTRNWVLRHKNDNIYKENKFFYHIKERYGLTKDQYNLLLINQNNRCSICGNEFNNKKDPCIDHDHYTKKIRSILCRKCNSLLGLSEDNITILINTIKYLEKFKNIN